MRFLEKLLKKTARFQHRFAYPIFILVILFTIFMLIGVSKIEFQSDMAEMTPQQLPIYQLNDKITDKFGGQDSIMVLIYLDDEYDFSDLPKDIRHPDIVNYINNIHESLESESSINSDTSVGSYIPEDNSVDVDSLTYLLNNYPSANNFFSDDYDTTYLLIQSDLGGGKEKVSEITDLVSDKLDSFSKPPGTKIEITGTPPVEVTLLSILIQDAQFTILLACIIIFLFLLFIEGSLIRTILIFTPLVLGLIWTIGSMGWLEIRISMVTAGLGAMLLGLGVEYGVFMLKRYEEERHKGNGQLESLSVSVPAVGSAILGSGMTTTIGFSALMISVMPMLQKLGASLAMGILYSLFSAVFIAPVFYIVFEKCVDIFDKNIYMMLKEHIRKREEGDII